MIAGEFDTKAERHEELQNKEKAQFIVSSKKGLLNPMQLSKKERILSRIFWGLISFNGAVLSAILILQVIAKIIPTRQSNEAVLMVAITTAWPLIIFFIASIIISFSNKTEERASLENVLIAISPFAVFLALYLITII